MFDPKYPLNKYAGRLFSKGIIKLTHMNLTTKCYNKVVNSCHRKKAECDLHMIYTAELYGPSRYVVTEIAHINFLQYLLFTSGTVETVQYQYFHQDPARRSGIRVGSLDAGSPMSPVDSKKWQCPLSLFFLNSCRFLNSPMSPVDFKKWQFPLLLF